MADLANGRVERAGAFVLVATALMGIGVIMVASVSAPLDRSLFSESLWRTPFGRQAVFAVAGFLVMLIIVWLAERVLASPLLRCRSTQVLFGLTVACLAAALVPAMADAHHGSHRWLRFSVGGVALGFQPSELAKLAMVGMLAVLLCERGAAPQSFRHSFLPASFVMGVCVLLVGVEDFGTSVLLAGVGVAMLFVAGSRLRHLALLGAGGAMALTGLLFAAPYRLARLTAFDNIWSDPQGAGYQPLQSLATIASGGWLGKGLGAGVQKYGYLPESHTDFIFAVICEEMGMLGAGLVIALFCAFVFLGLRAMSRARSRFERLLAFGLTTTIGLQAAMNIAVVAVATPTTGISLPLISAGGSGLMTVCLAIGVLGAIAARGDRRAFAAMADVSRAGTYAEARKEATW